MDLIEERFDLGLRDLDACAALQTWLGLGRACDAFLIEKSAECEDLAFLGAGPFDVLTADARAGAGNAFATLGRRLKDFRVKGKSTPFSCGAVGYLAYEMARHLERLPIGLGDGQEARLMLFDRVVVIDRRRKRAELVALLAASRRARDRAEAAALAATLARAFKGHRPSAENFNPLPRSLPEMAGTLGRTGFFDGVRAVKKHIRAGDIFQCVLSERFEVPVASDPFRVYRALSLASPSPYRFLLKNGEDYLIGASPERLIKVLDGVALNCPIAGTRPRGKSAAQDRAFERALMRSPKERAEHLMLVDLARNDLGRVCRPGTIRVRELMKVRRFSNVMHLVSQVEGRLERADAWEALMASFPAGTVSGAPKVRAMEIIASLERAPRQFYAGAVLQHDFSGNLDSCIAIRTMRLMAGKAVLQAGAGIVADSSPAREYQEVLNKLLGLRQALALAEA